MPTTSQNVSLIESAVTGYSRPQILSLLDELQLIVYSQRTDETLAIDPATGYPPFLVTVDGTKRYNCPENCWMTACIFSDEPIRTYGNITTLGGGSTYYWQNKGFSRIPISSTSKLVGTLATVTFRENPGATTEKFYHSYWITPTRLTVESIELSIPEHVHYIMRNAVQAMLSTENFGQTGFDDDVMAIAASRVRRELNRGAHGRIGRTPIRQENLNRDFNDC